MSYEQRDGSTDLSDSVSKLYSVITSARDAGKSFDELANDFVGEFSNEIILPAVQYSSKELEKIAFPYAPEIKKKPTRGQLISFGFGKKDDACDWCCVNLFEEADASFTRVLVNTFFKGDSYLFWWFSKINTKRVLYEPVDDISVTFDEAEFNPLEQPPDEPYFQIEDIPSRRVVYDKRHINGEKK